jgi:hypothetical protein
MERVLLINQIGCPNVQLKDGESATYIQASPPEEDVPLRY